MTQDAGREPEHGSSPWWARADDVWSAPPGGADPHGAAQPTTPLGGVATQTAPVGSGVDSGAPPADPWRVGYPADSIGERREPKARRLGWLIPVVALLAALVGGVLGGVIAWQASDHGSGTSGSVTLGSAPSAQPIQRPPGSIGAIANKLLNSVVSIKVNSGSQGDLGSGVLITGDGYVLTNNHVIAAAHGNSNDIKVDFNNKQEVGATVVGQDPDSDLAVIKVRVSHATPAPLGNSDALAVGDEVIAIGSPLGYSGSVTSGIVSGLDRPVFPSSDQTSQPEAVIDAIQTDAAINPGNSGGALVAGNGTVVGINSAIATLGSSTGSGSQSGSIGVGFAIPINQARAIAQEIIRTGKATHAIVGVRIDQNYDGRGVRVAGSQGKPAVTPGSPADKAGIREGDVITKVGDVVVTAPEELLVQIRKHRPGDRISLTYIRDGKTTTVSLTLASAPSSGG